MNLQISSDVGRTYDLLKGSGTVEVLFLKGDTNKTRFYNEREAFLKEVAYMNQEGFTCYAGIQPRDESLMNGTRSGENGDVQTMEKLYVDLDPVRPNKTNSTDKEKAEALTVAKQIQKDFEEQGYQVPVIGDSGNGYWVFFSIPEIEISDENRSHVAAKLKAWGQDINTKYSTEAVDVDNGIYDLRRVTKVFGTKIFNKQEIVGRPQRMSCFVDGHNPIPDEKLREDFLSIPVEVVPNSNISALEGKTPYNLDRLFERCYLLRFLKEKSEAGTNLTHSVRLALSTISLGLNDLENDLSFIKTMLQGMPGL